jgi:hypothetical protein
MQLKKATIRELGEIMKEEFKLDLTPADLEKFAYSLVGYFSLLLKAETRERNKAKFGNSSASRIDNKIQKGEDKEDIK